MNISIKLLIPLAFIIIVNQSFAIEKINPQNLVKARLISEVTSVKAGEPFYVALRLEMEEGWHTYWKNPGDAGLKTSIEWDLPEGFKAGEIEWPVPERIEFSDLANFGYEKEVNLLIKITASTFLKEGEKVVLKGEANWLVCKEKCYPGKTGVSLTLPVFETSPAKNIAAESIFSGTREALPAEKTNWSFEAEYQGNDISLYIIPPDGFKGDLNQVVFFPEDEGIYKNGKKPEFVKNNGFYQLRVELDNFRIEDPATVNAVLVSNLDWSADNKKKAIKISVPIKNNP